MDMQERPDIATVELSRTRIRLRDDLRWMPQHYSGEVFYHLEVIGTSEYFRVGYEEYVFLSLLDGHTSFAEALAVSSQILREKALSKDRASVLYSWLMANGLGLLVNHDAATSADSVAAVRGTKPGSSKSFNPLWIRLPIGQPGRLVEAAAPVLGWLFAPTAMIASLLVLILGGTLLWHHREQFAPGMDHVFSGSNWMWMLVAWIGLKAIHELGHGLVCHRYGGVVREAGLVLAIFTPMAYIDASCSWSFRSRWQRIHVAIAGIYVELIVAAICIMVWTQATSPVVRQQLYNVILMASIATILFNLNPLMKFDGYYVLSDLLQIPNLATLSREAVQRLIGRFVFGEMAKIPDMTGRRYRILVTYGIAAWIWRCLVAVSLMVAASALFHGAGIALTLLGAAVWFGRPLLQGLRSVRRMSVQDPQRLVRASIVTTVLALVIAGLVTGVPAPIMTTAPGIVSFHEGQVIRAQTSGFVDVVHVQDGQEVRQGDLLISLRNAEVTAQYHALQHQLAAEDLRVQTASREHDHEALNVAEGNRKSLRRQLAECQRQQEELEIRAARDGRVIGRRLSELRGIYAESGMELMTLGYEHEKDVQISVQQRDLQTAHALIGRPVRVRIGTHRVVSGTLVKLNPRVSRSVPHPAMAAVNGGLLAVEDVSRTENGTDRTPDRLRLVDYRFVATIQLNSEDSLRFRSGERGLASLGISGSSIGKYVWQSARDWLSTQLERARSGT
jgi:putative peptide zinc metalloprotease protein